jgi:hypothetical protein
MAIQFPQNPYDGQVYPDYDAGDAPLENGLTYYWSDADGAWQVSCDASDEYVKRAGDNMSGYLFLRDSIGQTQLATDEAHATTKAYVDRRFTEIEEELDGIAPSVQRGTWYYNGTELSANRNPGTGKFYLQKNNNGNQTVVSTYAAANQIVIHNTNSAGETQTFGSASFQDILSMYNVEDDGFVLGEIQAVGDDAGGYRIITFTPDSAALQPIDNKLARLNIFNPPSGGNISEYLNKTTNDQIGLKDNRDINYKIACSDGSSNNGVKFKLDTDKDQLQVENDSGNITLTLGATGMTAYGNKYLRDTTYLSYGSSAFETRLYGRLNLAYYHSARVHARTDKANSDKSNGSGGYGTAGQVLKSNGNGGPVYWGDAAASFRYGTETNPSLSTGEGYLNTDQRVLYIGL